MHLCRTLPASLEIILSEEVHDGAGEHDVEPDGDQAPPDHVPDAPSAGLSDTAQAGPGPARGWLTESHLVTAGGLGAQLRLRPETRHTSQHLELPKITFTF